MALGTKALAEEDELQREEPDRVERDPVDLGVGCPNQIADDGEIEPRGPGDVRRGRPGRGAPVRRRCARRASGLPGEYERQKTRDLGIAPQARSISYFRTLLRYFDGPVLPRLRRPTRVFVRLTNSALRV